MTAVFKLATFYVSLQCLIACILCIQYRDAINEMKQKDEVKDFKQELSRVHFHTESDRSANVGPCQLHIQKDFPKHKESQPLYIIPNTNKLWLPSSAGWVEVPHGDAIEIYCDSTFIVSSPVYEQDLIEKNTKVLQPTCVHGKFFNLNGRKHELKQFICNKPIKYAVERISRICGSERNVTCDEKLYRVGFNVTENRFITTMEIYYDESILRTIYTHYQLGPQNVYFQHSVKRLNFSKVGKFTNINMNYLYSQKNQQQQLQNLLKSVITTESTTAEKTQPEKYFDNRSLFLSRGHLAAKSDFIYANEQRSTFTFLNVAPQWQSFNSGEWATLEDQIKQFLAKKDYRVDCYTGTWGTLEVTLANQEKKPFYLSEDENNNGILPIPKLYYRVLVEKVAIPRRGIVMLGVNNPHATLQEIHDTYVICKDIQENVPWLRWIRNTNLKKGYIYACTVSEFVRKIGQLPLMLYEVNETLT